jgi:3-deoxy-D-manno-octulosonic-acid transferase
VATALDTLKPSLIVLTESELWPNFLSAANKRSLPVIAVNARMSPRSFSRLRRFAGLAQRYAFSQMTRFAVQEADYAVRLQQLGVPPEKLAVTGSIKYDGALKERSTTKTEMLRDLLGCGMRDSSETIVWLAGSTHAPEEAIVLSVHSRLRVRFPHLRLILVPRHRFEEVARLIVQSGMPHVRRSEVVEALPEMPSVVLLDSLGELGAAWGLADVGFAGGSLDGKRGGQSMIEPAGYGVPCTFGPHVWNFRDAAKRLVEVGGAMMVPDARGLEDALAKLLADPQLRMQMGTAAVNFVRSQQGATARTLEAIDRVIDRSKAAQAA